MGFVFYFQKLKAAITQNVQQSVLNNNLRVMSEAVERVTAQSAAAAASNPQGEEKEKTWFL